MIVLELQSLAQLATERVLNTAAEGVVVAGLVWLLLRLVGRPNSGTRFAIWFSALLAIVALPFFSDAIVTGLGYGILSPAKLPMQIILSPTEALCLFAAWAVGAGVLLLRLGVGLWHLQEFRRNCTDWDPITLDPTITGGLRAFESSRQVKVCVSTSATVPAAVGFFRPAIVFPEWLLPELSAEEIEIILLHELAHLRRRDGWTNLAQKILRAVFFFHPAVWWIERRLTLEREMACDDMVLAQTECPRAYASSLISFAEKLHGGRGLELAQALVSRMRQMSVRVAQILDADRPRRTGVWKPALGLSASLLVLALGAAPYVPRVVEFEKQPSQDRMPRMQAALQPPGADAQPALIRAMAERTAQDGSVQHGNVQSGLSRSEHEPRARAIPAAYYPHKAVPLKLKPPSRQPVLMQAQTAQEEAPMPETIFILRTTQYDASGTVVRTLCIWRVEGTNPDGTRVESAILVRLI